MRVMLAFTSTEVDQRAVTAASCALASALGLRVEPRRLRADRDADGARAAVQAVLDAVTDPEVALLSLPYSPGHTAHLVADVIQRCPRPVLVVPATTGDGRMQRALIAWDGGREVVRAIHDALPLLRKANSTVELAMIDGHARGSLEPLVDHLRRHRIGVEGEVHLRTGGSTAGALVDRLKQGHFDLLIMGAFGHPVWIEFLFGGTTPSALFNASTPVLISH